MIPPPPPSPFPRPSHLGGSFSDRVPRGKQVDDIEDEWLNSAPFDYIHSRYLAAAILDWPKLLRQTFQYVSSLLRMKGEGGNASTEQTSFLFRLRSTID